MSTDTTTSTSNPGIFSGEARGVVFHSVAASYAAGKVTLRLRTLKPDGLKGPAGRLAEALNGRWTNRCKGYHLVPSRAAAWKLLFEAGWDAEMDWRGVATYGTREGPKFQSPDGRAVSLKEAITEVSAL